MQDYLKQLNPSQQEAVKATEGPVMIIAGAGSGKPVATFPLNSPIPTKNPPRDLWTEKF